MGILGILGFLVAIANLVVAIMVLIKLFQTEGALKGVLGFICMFYTFIWGWMNANKLNIKNLMIIWTVLFILVILLNVFGGMAAVANLPTSPATP
jgi:hypothetical protein